MKNRVINNFPVFLLLFFIQLFSRYFIIFVILSHEFQVKFSFSLSQCFQFFLISFPKFYLDLDVIYMTISLDQE